MDGRWCDAADGRTFAVHNPATGETLGTVPLMGRAETQRAINAARKAWPAWRKLPAAERGRLLRALYDAILANADDLARLMTLEQGKPLAEARGEVLYAAGFIGWFAEETRRVYGSTIPRLGMTAEWWSPRNRSACAPRSRRGTSRPP